MDVAWAAAVAAGVLCGAFTGLVPGIHTNTLAAILLAFAPEAGTWGVTVLLAAAAAHTFLSVLPTTYVGVPDDAGLSVLPAHRLLLEGRGPEAVRVAADATMAGTLVAVLLVLPFKWLTAEPGGALELLSDTLPWVLVATTLFLLAQEGHKGPRAMAAAALCTLVAGALGLVAVQMRLTAWVPLPATPLLPLLSGLFGAAGLVHSLRGSRPAPPQDATPKPLPRSLRRGVALASWRGVAAAAWTVATPGLTAAAGASVALATTRQRDPRVALACMNAVGAAHQVFAVALLWLALRTRTGTTIALHGLLDVQAWDSGRPPTGLLDALLTLLAAACLAYAFTLAAQQWAARRLAHFDSRKLSLAALAVLVALVALLGGWLGLVLLVASGTVGLLPIAFGVRRVHLAAALIAPVLVARL
jgi:putative membrane protein